MDSRRRVFTGLLRRLLVLRDDVCATPWCDGVIAHADHARPVRDGGTTAFENGNGKCARCNYVKEAPGWRVRLHPPRLTSSGRLPDSADDGAWHLADRPVAGTTPELEVTTPLGRRYVSHPPPLLGWGWQGQPQLEEPRDAVDRQVLDRRAVDVIRAPTSAEVGLLGDATGSALERFLASLTPAA